MITTDQLTAFLALAESLRQMRGTTKAFESARDRYETACRTLAPLLAARLLELEELLEAYAATNYPTLPEENASLRKRAEAAEAEVASLRRVVGALCSRAPLCDAGVEHHD